jgi:hypothetical protein
MTNPEAAMLATSAVASGRDTLWSARQRHRRCGVEDEEAHVVRESRRTEEPT